MTKPKSKRESAKGKYNLYGDDWEDSVDFAIKSFEDLPHRLFGVNQHMIINYELKEALRQRQHNLADKDGNSGKMQRNVLPDTYDD